MDKLVANQVLELIRGMDFSLIYQEMSGEDLAQILCQPGDRRDEILQWALLPYIKTPSGSSNVDKAPAMVKILKNLGISDPENFIDLKSDKPLLTWKLLLELRKFQVPIMNDSFSDEEDSKIIDIDKSENQMNLSCCIKDLISSLHYASTDKHHKSPEFPSLIPKDIPVDRIVVPTLETLQLMQDVCDTNIAEAQEELKSRQSDPTYVPLKESIKEWKNNLEIIEKLKPQLNDFQKQYDSELKSWVDLCKSASQSTVNTSILHENFSSYDFYKDLSELRSSLSNCLKF